MKKKDLETQLFYIGLILPVIGIGAGGLCYYIHNLLPGMQCMLWSFAGIYCPGCGGTRAVMSLLHGKLLLSLWYHPLVLYCLVLFSGFMVTQGLHRLGVRQVKGWKFHNWYLYGAVILLVCNFLLKNILWLIWGIAM